MQINPYENIISHSHRKAAFFCAAGSLVPPPVKAAKHLFFSMAETVFRSGEMGVLPRGQLECE